MPGFALALLIMDVTQPHSEIIQRALLGLLSACCISSANYVINEFLDSEFDRLHPIKRHRAAAAGTVDGRIITVEYLAFATAGLTLALYVAPDFLLWSAVFLGMGIIYNVAPLRTKDWPIIDVLSEALNNPIRLLLGWYILSPAVLPPSSLLLSYWMAGGYLMAVKRFAELRRIGDADLAQRYRPSFKYYTQNTLLLSAFFYAITSALFLGVFLIKYRIEFVLSFPFLTILFVWYLHIGMQVDSTAQAPETLYREKKFAAYTCFVALLLTLLFAIDIPSLHILVDPIGR